MLNITSHQEIAKQNHGRRPFTPTRVARIKGTGNERWQRCGWERCGEIGALTYFWWGNKMVEYSFFGKEFFKKLNVELPFDPATPLLDIYPRKMKMYVHTKMCAGMKAALWPKIPSTNEWTNKIQFIHISHILQLKQEWSTDTRYSTMCILKTSC